MNKPGVLIVRKIPPRLRARFKASCAARGTTMQEAIAALLRLYVREPGVLEQKAKSDLPSGR